MIKFQVRIALFLLASCLVSAANAQEKTLNITYRVNSNNSVDFDFTKTDPGTWTILLKFNDLRNYNGPREQQLEAKNYSGRLTSLQPTNKNEGIGFSYSYHYIRGRLKPKYNPDFIYLLPYKNDVKVFVSESSFANATYFGNTTPDDWKSYRFFTAQEDSVTTIRKGTVVEIKDLYDTDDSENIVYTNKNNEVIIEHSDGTLAAYRGFKKGSISVKLGQVVIPGTPLGVNIRTNGNPKYGISILLYYLKSADFDKKNEDPKITKSFYGFITPHFSTAENSDLILTPQQQYTASHNLEVVKKELSKKELSQIVK